MNDKEIREVFERLALLDKELPEYKDPYSFTKNIEECFAPKYQNIIYSSGTTSIKDDNHA